MSHESEPDAEERGDERDAESGEALPELALALARARRHSRTALAEALEAVRALLDAAALATSGVPAEAHGLLRTAARGLERAASGLSPEADGPAVVEALAEALDAEIARWESRADEDSEARAVLRAFLGVRELLWELGVRRKDATRARGPAVVRRRTRVERVHVEGDPA